MHRTDLGIRQRAVAVWQLVFQYSVRGLGALAVSLPLVVRVGVGVARCLPMGTAVSVVLENSCWQSEKN